MGVHPTAIVEDGAKLGADVEIGPFCTVGDGVVLGDGCRVGPNACLEGPLELGEACVVGFSAVLGGDPQIRDPSEPFGGLRIGSRNVFREFVQVHRSSKPDASTTIGDDGYFMAGSHVAHDCVVGDSVTLVNHAALAGHVEVQDRAFLAGDAMIHQFVRVGELAMVGGKCGPASDVPPFCTAVGVHPTRLVGLNVVGMRRAGVSPEARRALKAAFRVLFRGDLPLRERLAAVERGCPEVDRLVAFLESSKRGAVDFGGRTDD